MIARIRKSMQEKDQGFTLIELLVVIIIIGILAAIAIPVFLNQRKKAYDAAVQSDLKTLSTNLETFFVDHNTYAGTDQAYWTTEAAIHVSKGTKYEITAADANHYVIDGLSQSGKWFELDSSNGGAPTDEGTTFTPTGTASVTIDNTSGTQSITVS